MTPTPSCSAAGSRASASLTSPRPRAGGPFPPCSAQRLPSIPRRSSPVPLVSGAAPRVANISVQAGDDAACWPLRHSPALAATLNPRAMVARHGMEAVIFDDRSRDDLSGRRAVPLD
jgi:hypothetical protein